MTTQLKHGLRTAAGIGAALATWALVQKRPPYKLRGKVVLITGGSRGLGLQMARQFGAEGARIVICARHSEGLERARQDIEQRSMEGGRRLPTVFRETALQLSNSE